MAEPYNYGTHGQVSKLPTTMIIVLCVKNVVYNIGG